jgi:type VI secretion system protein ImpH
MEAEGGTEDLGLRRQLLKQLIGADGNEKYFGLEFFQAVRLLARLRGTTPPGRFGPAATESVHFGTHHHSGFPAGDIRSIVWPEPERGGEEFPPPEMRVSFMGLTGPSGVLPLAYTEHVRSLCESGDDSTADFFDIFNHRIISLFYQAWEKNRFFVAFEREGSDPLTERLMNLNGLGTPGLQGRQAIPDRGVLLFSGLLALAPRSALALQQIISQWFRTKVRVNQFHGAWFKLRTDDCCQFTDKESGSQQLGTGLVLGDAVFDRGSQVQIMVGPLGIGRYHDFLPGGFEYERLRAVLDYFSNGSFEFEIRLILKREEVPEFNMGNMPTPLRLGWTTWMNAKARTEDPHDSAFRFS